MSHLSLLHLACSLIEIDRVYSLWIPKQIDCFSRPPSKHWKKTQFSQSPNTFSPKFKFSRWNQLNQEPCSMIFWLRSRFFVQLACIIYHNIIISTCDTQTITKNLWNVSGWSLGWWTLWCRVTTSNTRETWRALGRLVRPGSNKGWSTWPRVFVYMKWLANGIELFCHWTRKGML